MTPFSVSSRISFRCPSGAPFPYPSGAPLPFHSERLSHFIPSPSPVSFRTPLSRVIPNAVRNPPSGIRREMALDSKRFLVVALLGMTPFSRVIPDFFPVSLRAPLPCHSERSEESAVGNTAGNGGRLKEIPLRGAPRDGRAFRGRHLLRPAIFYAQVIKPGMKRIRASPRGSTRAVKP